MELISITGYGAPSSQNAVIERPPLAAKAFLNVA
jgi:hypothetical protein